LLPPDNATGNFTKVVQRIPVKIALDSSSVELRPGMSVIPTIQTQRRQPTFVSAPPLATHSSVALLALQN
jgi:membrane fusion protein (multidrug efflux system)